MKIEDVLVKELFINDLKAKDKQSVLRELTQKLLDEGYISDKADFLSKLEAREKISSTGFGNQLAIPHVKSDDVKETVVLFAKSKSGVEFEAMDKQPVSYFFLIATPSTASDKHLNVLANLSKALIKPEVFFKLSQVEKFEDLKAIFKVAKAKEKILDSNINIVAVTACATGIAHTYMAAEKLIEAARSLGYNIKVETNGSSGILNKLSEADIKKADAVIVASDINVEKNRFDNKQVILVPVAKAIKDPKSLIKAALDAPLYTGIKKADDESHVVKMYGHLLNGVSYMLPFVVGGGILVALAFLIDQIIGVPKESLAQLGSYNEVAKTFNEIGSITFGFMLPVLAGYIAYSIVDRPGLVVGFLAGAIASQQNAGFIGALIGGFVAGYSMKLLKKLLVKLPDKLEGIKTILLYPVLGIIIVGCIMFLLTIPMRAINIYLNDLLMNLTDVNSAALGFLLGGMMAADLGGPINKAAYLFATATLASKNGEGTAVMAAVMAAGMVAPLATSVATFVYKDKYNEKQKQAGFTNLILGASFITEGAIPFASSDPIRVLPGLIFGSGITGALVMLSNILHSAPHGGIFVIFLVSKPLLYLLYILIGSIISGLIIGFLKRK